MSHIALLLPDLEAGGAQRVMLLLAREFAARGHRVDILLLRRCGAFLESVPRDVSLVALGARGYGCGQAGLLISGGHRLATWLKRERPNAVLSSITGANLVAALVAYLRPRIRIVIREAVTLENVRNPLRLWAMRRLYPCTHAVVALSPHMADELMCRLGVAPERTLCIPNPVDGVFIRTQAAAPLAHAWLDDPDLRVIVAAGRLIPQKDHATLLHAFALLPTDLPVRLLILGDGPERLALECLAGSLGIAQNVQLVGFDPNPWRWMGRADLFVLTSRWEGHPNSLLEALALGLPAVAAAYDPSANDLAVRHGVTVVPPADPAELAQTMARLVSGPIERRTGWVADIDAAVNAYLAALDLPESALGQAAPDHKTAAAAK